VWAAAATWSLWSAGTVGASVAEGLRCAVVCLLVASVVQLARTLAVGGRERALALVAAALALWPLAGVPWALALGAVVGIALLRGGARSAVPVSGTDSESDGSAKGAGSADAPVSVSASPARWSEAASPREPASTAMSHLRAAAPPWWGLCALAAAWLAPLLFIAAWQGGRVAELTRELGELALFGFGGAYTMVAWFGGAAVEQGWVAPALVAEALGVAEATPGPLVLATQFLSHHALACEPGASAPLVAGTLGAIVALWSIFPPSALWVLAATGPYERVRHAPLIAPLFAGVRCASLGVLCALGIQLAQATLWQEAGAARPIDVGSLATCAALGGWMAWKRPALPVVLGAGIALRVTFASCLGI
jgi:chromate transporter